MKDRIPTYPGRVRLTPVVEEENVFDLERADQPTEEGTPINKATLLSDYVAQSFGLENTAVPNDVFGLFVKTHWKKYKIDYSEKRYKNDDSTYGFTDDSVVNNAGMAICGSTGSATIEYGDSISFDSDGEPMINNPQTATVTRTNLTPSVTFWVGKYFRFVSWTTSDTYINEAFRTKDVFFGVSPGKYIQTYNNNIRYLEKASGFVRVKSEEGKGEFVGTVFDDNETAYPSDGIQGGYYYELIGRLFENLKSAPKFEMGSYLGTGTYGANAPISIKFSFRPKLVFLYGYDYGGTVSYNPYLIPLSNYINVPIIMSNLTTDYKQYLAPSETESSAYAGYIKRSDDGKMITWYSRSATAQLNYEGYVYHWYAIG